MVASVDASDQTEDISVKTLLHLVQISLATVDSKKDCLSNRMDLMK